MGKRNASDEMMNSKSKEEQANLHDRLHTEGWRMLDGEVHLQGRGELRKPGWFSLRNLKKAITLFEQMLAINPTSWSAMWALGKIYQRMDDDAKALEWFTRAHQIEPLNPDVMREAALSALNVGKGKEAEDFTTAAIELKPNDAGLISNLALALLLNNKSREARERAEEAVRANPADFVSKNVLQFIDDVVSGKRPYPKSLREIS